MLIRFFLWLLSIDWTKYRPATCLPKHCFCEAIGTGFVRQPVNAYTNIAFILASIGMLLFLVATRKSKEKISVYSHLPRNLLILFALASMAVGIGSFIYHAGFTFLGMELDDDSMYLVGSFMLLFGLAHLRHISLKHFLLYYLALNISLEIIIYFFPVVRGFLFGLLILGMLIIDVNAILQGKLKNYLPYFWWGIGLFFLGYFFWILDDTRLVCYPTALFQGHAVWHLLSAMAGLAMFFYMDSEFREKGRQK